MAKDNDERPVNEDVRSRRIMNFRRWGAEKNTFLFIINLCI